MKPGAFPPVLAVVLTILLPVVVRMPAADAQGLDLAASATTSATSDAADIDGAIDAASGTTLARSVARRVPERGPTYRAAMQVPRPVDAAEDGIPSTLPSLGQDADPSGWTTTYRPAGPVDTAGNAFFQDLGSNGRSCGTCHRPASAMGLGLPEIRHRWIATGGQDPLFAAVDGAVCPSAVPALSGSTMPADRAAHALLLTRGLFRVFLPMPDNAEFTLSVVSDPYGCNTDPRFDEIVDPSTGLTRRMVSVYRRPLMAADLGFTGTGLPPSGTQPFMSDQREPSLSSQALDATLVHAQAAAAPSAAAIAEIVAFERGVFTAQGGDRYAGWLSAHAAEGGAVALSDVTPGTFAGTAGDPPTFSAYAAWSDSDNASRASIARGEAIFDTRRFAISDVGNFNDAIGVNPLAGATCATCHNQVGAGNDLAGTAHVLGTVGDSPALGGPPLDPTLPVFRLTCLGTAKTAYLGSVVTTNDPGRALITGKCADIGGFKTLTLRGLAARAPYFHNGSAATLDTVVDFYDRRFSIGLTRSEHDDLVDFLKAL